MLDESVLVRLKVGPIFEDLVAILRSALATFM